MPPNFSSRCWAALCGKYPQLVELGNVEPELIIAGSYDAFIRVKPDAVNGIPPTLAQVTQYFQELGSRVNPQDFLDHYDMVGWIVGSSKSRMKDWRAACRLWDRRQKTGSDQRTRQGSASLFALQTQVKQVEDALNDILFPAGSSMKVVPQPGAPMERYNDLMAQRKGLKEKINAIALG
jgi:hypothetical protein